MPGWFQLTINLGNAEMQTHEHVASALRAAADRVDAGDDSGLIRDLNGNTVGAFSADGNLIERSEDGEEDDRGV